MGRTSIGRILAVAAALAGPPAVAQDPDLIDVLATNGNFTFLVAVLDATGLADQLREPGAFTLFAPTDDAFLALPAEEMAALRSDAAAIGRLALPGILRSRDLAEGGSAETLGGDSVTFTLQGGAKVNGVRIIAADIPAANGIIHVVDALIPPS